VGRSRRVLVIDDDALARSMLADAFESQGFEVLTAPDAMSGPHT
jgi:DNA-binding response OmpR family regulator